MTHNKSPPKNFFNIGIFSLNYLTKSIIIRYELGEQMKQDSRCSRSLEAIKRVLAAAVRGAGNGIADLLHLNDKEEPKEEPEK